MGAAASPQTRSTTSASPASGACERVSAFVCAAFAAVAVALAAPSIASAIDFDPAQTYQIGSRPESVAVADVTGDGRRDVLVSTSRTDGGPNDDKLFLFRQQSNGSLAPPLTFVAGSDPYVLLERGLGTGDLDGDSDTDVALATWNGLALYHQQDGTLEGPSFLAGTTEAREVEVADMNADASNDLVISAGDRGVLVAKHEGAGFTVVTATPDAQGEVEVGDVTGDGRLDIVGFSTRFVRVYPQLSDGTYGGPIFYEGDVGYWPNGEGLEVADVSGDGRADVLSSRLAGTRQARA
jgi:serine protease